MFYRRAQNIGRTGHANKRTDAQDWKRNGPEGLGMSRLWQDDGWKERHVPPH